MPRDARWKCYACGGRVGSVVECPHCGSNMIYIGPHEARCVKDSRHVVFDAICSKGHERNGEFVPA